MELVKLTHNDRPTLINGDHIISIAYEESTRHLEIKFINGDELILGGDEAAAAWASFNSGRRLKGQVKQ